MTRTEESLPTRVRSGDGTEIACWHSGVGPPLLLVHGTTADHSRWRPLLSYLEPHATVYTMDRRGRGASGDGADYALAREYEDVAAVVEAIAADRGCDVDLLGHSYGGMCAYGAATVTSNIRKLVLYEGWPTPNAAAYGMPPHVRARMEALLARDEREAALEVFFREEVRMPDEEFAVYRALPAWRTRIAAAHTITREDRAVARDVLDPELAGKITVPVLLLVGSDSPDSVKRDFEAVAAVLSDVRITILEGQQHIAMDLTPEAFAEVVLSFLRKAI
jgi:pimeloyl-ACP methyl ester carboxylesterase